MSDKPVFCEGCCHLFILCNSHTVESPACLKHAEFEGGPLRKHMDLAQRFSAEKYNLLNDCPYKSKFSLKTLRIKRWILWRINTNEKDTFWEGTLRDYPIQAEYKKRKVLRDKLDSLFDPEEISEDDISEETEFPGDPEEIEGDSEDSIFNQRGTDSDGLGEPSDKL